MNERIRNLISTYREDLRKSEAGTVMVRGAGSAFAIKISGTGIALAVQIFLARLLKVESFGQYIYVLSWLNLVALTSILGLDTASLRFVAEYQGLEKWGLLRGFLQRSSQIGLACSCFIALLAVGAVYLLKDRLGSGLSGTFWVACLILPAFVLLQIRNAALRAFKKIVQAQAPMEILRPSLVAGGVLLLFIINGQSPRAPAAMTVNLLATIIALIVTNSFLHRALPNPAHTVSRKYRSSEWIRVALPLLMISGFLMILSQIDIIMVGALLDTTKAGIYSAANRLATLISFGLVAVNTIAAPMISELYAQGKIKELQRIVSLGSWGILAFSLPASIIILSGGKFILGLFGSAFTAGYSALVILTLGQLVNALSGSVGFLMTMTGQQKEAAKIVGTSAILNVLLNGFLIPRLGIIGAAVATSLSTATWNIAMLHYVLKHHGINPTALPLRRD
jgi:O-antigen/teichoic acid export membrane protein